MNCSKVSPPPPFLKSGGAAAPLPPFSYPSELLIIIVQKQRTAGDMAKNRALRKSLYELQVLSTTLIITASMIKYYLGGWVYFRILLRGAWAGGGQRDKVVSIVVSKLFRRQSRNLARGGGNLRWNQEQINSWSQGSGGTPPLVPSGPFLKLSKFIPYFAQLANFRITNEYRPTSPINHSRHSCVNWSWLSLPL